MPESLGITLKKIRESRHISLEEVSERTRIPQKILSAIEEDKLQNIASPFYAISFVKSYSTFLGALEEKALKDFLATSQKKEPQLILKRTGTAIERFVKHKRQIGAGVLVIFSVWILAFCFGQMKKVSKSQAIETKPKTTANSTITPKGAQGTAKPKTSEAKPSVLPPKEEPIKLEVVANYNTWIQVSCDSALTFRGTLKKGTKDTWEAKKGIRLELGNAGGVNLKLNGKNLGSPGKKGEKKEIVVTKGGIK